MNLFFKAGKAKTFLLICLLRQDLVKKVLLIYLLHIIIKSENIILNLNVKTWEKIIINLYANWNFKSLFKKTKK